MRPASCRAGPFLLWMNLATGGHVVTIPSNGIAPVPVKRGGPFRRAKSDVGAELRGEVTGGCKAEP